MFFGETSTKDILPLPLFRRFQLREMKKLGFMESYNTNLFHQDNKRRKALVPIDCYGINYRNFKYHPLDAMVITYSY